MTAHMELPARLQNPAETEPGEDKIHLWLVFQRDMSEESLLEFYLTLLTEEERQKASRFYFERHRSQYIVTRALIRTVLSRYSGVDPRAWRFSTNAYGRPYISSPAALRTLAFNIAHTDELIVCACTNAEYIGVDAEYLPRDNAPMAIAERYFSIPEVAELRALSPEARAERFYQFWVLKESYIKAIGKGLSARLDEFSFSLRRSGQIDLSFHGGLNDDPSNWRCWLIKPTQAHMVGLCARRTRNAQEIVARVVVPLKSAAALEWQLLALSPDD